MIYTHQNYLDYDDLLDIYETMRKEGSYSRMYVDGAFATANQWIDYIRGRCWLVRMTEDSGEPFAVFWLDGFNGSVAMFHYFVYRRAWGRTTGYILKELFAWLKDNIGDTVFNLIGYTPKSNRLAVRMLKRAGFEIKFEIEEAILNDGQYESMIVSYRRL